MAPTIRPKRSQEKQFLGSDTKIVGIYNMIVGTLQLARNLAVVGLKYALVANELDPRAKAMAAQLRAEIAASPYRKIAPFSRALDEILKTDPTTFFNRVTGKIPMPQDVLFASLDLLNLDYVTFVTRAMERLAPPPE